MNMDTSMPGIAGYLMAMMCKFPCHRIKVVPSYIKPSISADNPNNVATEASPLTTVLEINVGQQLSEMVGYNIDIATSPVGWGHITCDGSVANLESMWAGNSNIVPCYRTSVDFE
jgi:glutamate/tyrosine decarboxylase-like PLP-dependent enzyme